ncbi:hypothetical protein ACFSL4_17785 [Streptomyces caeni]|uniref:Uncharacterized protein n=1 Tax=Streptomyces caeni TaxID=2307231 RepID=A0ABW4IU23_9ACTN
MTRQGSDGAAYGQRGATEYDRGFLAEVDRHQPQLVRAERYAETWRRGPLEVTLNPLCDWYPPPVKAALQTYRQAVLDGHCPACGAYSRMTEGFWDLEHGETCTSSPEALALMAGAAVLEMFPAGDPDAPPEV